MLKINVNNRKISASLLLFIVLVVIFLVEFFIMIMVSRLYPFLGTIQHAFLGSLILSILFSPFLYFLVFKVIIKKEKEKEVFERRAVRMVEIIESSPDIVFIVEPRKYNIIYLNKSGRKYFKIDNGKKINIADIYPDNVGKLIINESIPEAIKNGVWEGEVCCFSHPDGTEHPFSSLIIANRRGGGGIDYIAVIMRDIFNRKQYEEKIESHIKELEQLNELMVGREVKMSELKKEIKELREKLKE